MDKATESTAIATSPKAESAHHLLDDAYDFGAKLLGKAQNALNENPNVAYAAMIGGALVTRNEGVVAGALKSDGERLMVAGTEEATIGRLAVAGKPMTEASLDAFKSAIKTLGRDNNSIASTELQSIRELTPRVPGQTGAQKLIEELQAAKTPAEKQVAVSVYGSFNRSYEGYRSFFGH